MANYTVKLEFNVITADSPEEAAKKIALWCVEDSYTFIYDIEDEETGEQYSIDLDDI